MIFWIDNFSVKYLKSNNYKIIIIMENPFLGVVFHWLGGLASGSFYVPYKGVKRWAWEVYWLVGGFFSWIICPWAFALLLTNDPIGAIKQQAPTTLWWTYFSG
jgi:L-rhamnose-H+ transport protein